MLVGITSSSAEKTEVGGGGVNPYPEAIVYINFVTGDCFLNNVAVSITDAIDQPGSLGPSGLQLGSARTRLAGDVLAAFAVEHGTVMAEYVKADNSGFKYPFSIEKAGSDFWSWSIFGSANYFQAVTYDGTHYGQVTDTLDDTLPHDLRVAMTRTAGGISFSALGRAVVSWTGTTGTIGPDRVGVGNEFSASLFNGYFKKLALFDPLSDAELPALSTL